MLFHSPVGSLSATPVFLLIFQLNEGFSGSDNSLGFIFVVMIRLQMQMSHLNQLNILSVYL